MASEQEIKEAQDTIKWALQRFPWDKVLQLAKALDDLGPDAAKVVRHLGNDKHDRAVPHYPALCIPGDGNPYVKGDGR